MRNYSENVRLRGGFDRRRHVFIGVLTMLAWMGCDWITSPGPQPRALDGYGYEAKLNVLGVLRPGGFDGVPLSFVHVEYAYPTTDIPDSATVADAEVTILTMEGDAAVDTAFFAYTPPDAVFETAEYRHPEFIPAAGRTYRFDCFREGYPRVTSTTAVPAMPVIDEGSMHVGEDALQFVIVRDTSAVVYEAVFTVGDGVYTQRVRRPETGDVTVRIDFDRKDQPEGTLAVYAYDLNLSEYITYNISIKPNTYRTDYSTVEGGYGCFGSLNLLERVIVF